MFSDRELLTCSQKKYVSDAYLIKTVCNSIGYVLRHGISYFCSILKPDWLECYDQTTG